MRLIDADALPREEFQIVDEWHMHKNVGVVFAEDIDRAPTVDDVAPVRHGHWDVREPMPMHDIKGNLSWGNWYVCTGCGFATTAIEGHITQYKYCPNCGARMDGEDDEL